MGRPELASDERFATSAGRCQHRDEANDAISTWLATQSDRDAVVAELEAQRIPTAPVLTLAEAATRPHLHEAGSLRWVDDEVLGRVLVPGMPIKFSDFPGDRPLSAQRLGQDNEYVVREVAGRSATEYHALVEAGVLLHDEMS